MTPNNLDTLVGYGMTIIAALTAVLLYNGLI